jgi:hypothetical protein
MVAIGSKLGQTIEKHIIITTEERSKVYNMPNIKFNASRGVVFLLLVTPMWLTTPAYAKNRLGSQFDPKANNPRSIENQRYQSLHQVGNQRRRNLLINNCQDKAKERDRLIDQKIRQELKRKPYNQSALQSLQEQKLESSYELSRCAQRAVEANPFSN